jgi:hypothetical protein
MANPRTSLDELGELATELGTIGSNADQERGVLSKAVGDFATGMSSALNQALEIIRLEKGKQHGGFGGTGKPFNPSSVGAGYKADGDDPDTSSDDHLSTRTAAAATTANPKMSPVVATSLRARRMARAPKIWSSPKTAAYST